MITWNVADNTGMGNKFTDDDIDAVLGLDGKQPQVRIKTGYRERPSVCLRKFVSNRHSAYHPNNWEAMNIDECNLFTF